MPTLQMIHTVLKPATSEKVITTEIQGFKQRKLRTKAGKFASLISPPYSIDYRSASGSSVSRKFHLKFDLCWLHQNSVCNWTARPFLVFDREDTASPPISGEIKFELLNFSGDVLQSHEVPFNVEAAIGTQFEGKELTFFPTKDTAKMKTTISVYEEEVFNQEDCLEQCSSGKAKSDATNLAEKLSNGDLVSDFSDFAIVSRQGDEIKSFKNIMAVQSPPFHAMLRNQGHKEVQDGKVHLSDFGTVTLRTFNHFLLTDGIKTDLEIKEARGEDEETDGDVVRNLLILGNKYDVESLVWQAENWLMKNLSAENALVTATVANMVNSGRLLDKCVQFVVANRKDEKLSMSAIRESGLSLEIISKILEGFW